MPQVNSDDRFIIGRSKKTYPLFAALTAIGVPHQKSMRRVKEGETVDTEDWQLNNLPARYPQMATDSGEEKWGACNER